MGDLRVELYGNLVGHLVGTGRTFDFRTDHSAFEHYEAQSTILSVSVPLSIVESRGQAARRRAYFTELLPEGKVLSDLAARVGVTENDVSGFLTHYGRDVAGAVQIWDPKRSSTPRSSTTRSTELGSRAGWGSFDMMRGSRTSPDGQAWSSNATTGIRKRHKGVCIKRT